MVISRPEVCQLGGNPAFANLILIIMQVALLPNSTKTWDKSKNLGYDIPSADGIA
jgi:hypothetical protein